MVLRYGLLFLPYVVAVLLQGSPTISYLVAWSGSFLILFLTLGGHVRPLPGEQPLVQNLLRPIGLTQLIFAGYTALTSIFYFMDLNGYFFLEYNPFQVGSTGQFELTAEAQRYYVLAHAAFSTGVLALMDYRRSGEWDLRPGIDRTWFALSVAVGGLLVAQGMKFGPGLGQIQVRISMLAFVASVLAFAVSIIQKRSGLILITGFVYGLNTVEAFISGWKSEMIVVFVLLCVFLYPYYKRAITAVAPVGLIALLIILPTYASIVRSLSWQGNVEAEEAAQIALNRTLEGEVSLARTNWQFLTGRLSEIGMFTDYIAHVPQNRPYYGLTLLEHGLMGVVPRIVWSGKPNMERLAMKRVYEAGVVEEYSRVSAKPKFVVDAYLSWGAPAVFLGFIVYGMLAALASRLAEQWFGGYLMGSGLVYTSLFREFWMSNAVEFFFNTVLWSFILMGALFVAGRVTGILVPARQHEQKAVA